MVYAKTGEAVYREGVVRAIEAVEGQGVSNELGLERDAAGHTLRDPEKIVGLCDRVPSQADYYEQCVIGAVNVIVDFWGEALEEQPFELCKMVEEEKAKEGCYSMLSLSYIQ